MKKVDHHRTNSICVVFFYSFLVLQNTVLSSDTLNPYEYLSHNRSLLSENQFFELGVFSVSRRWYLGIWYKQISVRTIVWIANREKPLRNSAVTFGIFGQAIVLRDEKDNVMWSFNATVNSTLALQLLDTGNLILRERDKNTGLLWQSFDHPTDSLLPNMKLGWDKKTGLNHFLTSWKSPEDPSSGQFTYKFNFRGIPEIFIWNNQTRVYRAGLWNGVTFSDVPQTNPLDFIDFHFVDDHRGVYFFYEITKRSFYSRLTITTDGEIQMYIWIPFRQQWVSFWYAPKDQCDKYRQCGPYGICDPNEFPVCNCVAGFKPKSPSDWNLRISSDGCVRKTTLDCRTDKFLRLKDVKLPETKTSVSYPGVKKINDCESFCLQNCSCRAYSRLSVVNGGSGCLLWFDMLFDMRQYAVGVGLGQDLYLRLAAADLVTEKRALKTFKILIVVATFISIIGISGFLLWKRKKVIRACKGDSSDYQERSQDLLLIDTVFPIKRECSFEGDADDLDLLLFDFTTLSLATNNFSEENKLGRGGFGSVYKGTLSDGQEVAMKKLSENSGQGVAEFKNEVKLIARLQHRNLVRLLGCCTDMDEKILIYEYMENGSLDSVIFDEAKRSSLNWEMRFNIIIAIARGLLYLHQDSRYRIIHRDLKASNVLLDKEWTPKISDFGMARLFGGDATESNTRRVVGTYGYMSPEYALDGIFSVKSDVFSFGVLVLEIISGKKNRGFYKSDLNSNLLGHAWKLLKEEKGLELLDASVGDCFSPSEVMRCIHVGLLCVEEQAEDRPNMSSVVLMLCSDTSVLPSLKTPGYCLGRNPLHTSSSSGNQDESFTINQVTITILNAR